MLDIVRLQHGRIPHDCVIQALSHRLIPRIINNMLGTQRSHGTLARDRRRQLRRFGHRLRLVFIHGRHEPVLQCLA